MRNVDVSKRWLALYVLCFGVLMIVLDTTIVNVALPSIREDLHFSETSLVWVVRTSVVFIRASSLVGVAVKEELRANGPASHQ